MPAPKYSPDPLSSGGSTEKPFAEGGTPKSSVVSTLLRLALRRMPAHGYAATKNTRAVRSSDAMTMGSHGSTR